MFKFRLQRLLDLREQKERDAATALGRAERESEAARAALANLEAVRQMGRERLVAAHGSQGTVGQLRNLAFVLEQIDRQVADASGSVRQAEAVAERMRQALGEAHQERRVIDRLRDRHESDWRGAEVQADRARMDEIALARYVQRTTPSSTAPTTSAISTISTTGGGRTE